MFFNYTIIYLKDLAEIELKIVLMKKGMFDVRVVLDVKVMKIIKVVKMKWWVI